MPLIQHKDMLGPTSDLDRRLKEHNAGKSPHTAKFGPWKTVVTIRFTNNRRAVKFEEYLKSGSGEETGLPEAGEPSNLRGGHSWEASDQCSRGILTGNR